MNQRHAFYNRAAELAALTALLASPRAELVVLYGRRGSGKSALLLQALAGHTAVYYQATSAVMAQQLTDLAAALREAAASQILPGVFPSLESVLQTIGTLARVRPDAPFCLVLDEFPYLAQAEPALESILQRWWDRETREEGTRNLKVFLAGSHVSWMRAHLLTEHAPLHNRRTAQLEVLPLSYRHAALFYPAYGPRERLEAFAVYGGLPSYLQEIDPRVDLWRNVRATILEPSARLAAEPDWLRFSDLRADALYASIIRAMATDHHTPSDIARAVGKERASDIFHQLEQLQALGIARRVAPIVGGAGARARYHLRDPFHHFWYRYVDPLRNLLARRQIDLALRRIRADFDQYVAAHIFEEVCRDFLWLDQGAGMLPGGLEFTDVGAWWMARKDAQDEIDVVAVDGARTVLVGECKWSNSPMDRRDLAGLDAALRLGATELQPIAHPWRALFSHEGFDDDLRALAADPQERLLLFTPAELYSLVTSSPPDTPSVE